MAMIKEENSNEFDL